MSDGRLPARRRWVGWTIGLILVVIVIAVGWVAVRGVGAAGELQSVRNSVAQLRTAIADRELERAERIAPRIVDHAALAHDLTSDALWRSFELLPWLGANFTALREVSEITDSVASRATAPLVDIAHELDPATLGFTGSRIDLTPLAAVRSSVETAAHALDAANARAQQIDVDAALPPVADAVREAQALVREAATTIGAMEGASALLPTMLGGSGEPRTYLVALVNNAELRSQGGAIAGLTLVRADRGALSILRTATGRDLPALDAPLPLDDATIALVGDAPGRSVRDATSIPDFASAAALVAERWQQQYGDVIDGIITLDLVAVQHLMGVTGPLDFGTGTANADTVTAVLGTDLPVAVPDAGQRDALLAQAGGTLLSAAMSSGEPAAVLEAIAAAADDDRIRAWSARPDEQQRLATSTLGGAIPADGARGIHVGVLLNDATGAPVDGDAHATISTAVGVCQGQPTTQVRVTWTTAAPAEGAAPTETRTLIAIYGPEGAQTRGEDTTTTLGDRPVVQHDIALPAGDSTTVTATFIGSGAGERLTRLHHTPMLDGPEVVSADLDCG